MAKRIAVAGQKGGIGKTSTAVNLSACLAKMNKRVLLVDFDSQGGATWALGIDPLKLDQEGFTSVEFTKGKGAFAATRNHLVSGLDVVPSCSRLAAMELELLGDMATGARQLSVAISRVEAEYDYVIIDCNPSLGMLALAAMVAGPNLLLPFKLDPASLVPVVQLHKHFRALKQKGHPELQIMGVLGTFYTAQVKTVAKMLAHGREMFPKAFFSTVIHRAQVIPDASESGLPVVLYDPKSRAAKEHMSFAEEVMSRV